MLIPPRLNKLLLLLLENDGPMRVNGLADSLGVSRRTVFRELENISALLKAYRLEIITKPGEGILLEGPQEGKQEALDTLRAMGEESEPVDKRERLHHLLLELLRNPELQKIYHYAALFKVSEGTISNDLETASVWLERYGLKLKRRQGLGILVEGEERDFRRALIRLLEHRAAGELRRLAQHGFLDSDILDEVCAILRGIHDPVFEHMTEDSQSRLAIYLVVVTERIRAGRTLTGPETIPPKQLALRLCGALEDSFGLTLSLAEQSCMEVQISGARNNYMDVLQEKELLLDHYELQRLTYRIIDRFDPELAYELKMDEALVKGLTFHLRSAVVRLQHGLELTDPLLEQMVQSYPDVYEKSKKAAAILWEEYQRPISDSEAGFLSMHFGAAVMRLRGRKARKRTVHVGVLCVNGIGVSYMVASQIKARFQSDVEVEVCLRDDTGEPGRFDFCVSSVPFEAQGLTVVETNAILQESDMERIGKVIAEYACLRKSAQAASGEARDFAAQLRHLELYARCIRVLLEQFHVVPVETGCTFGDLVKLAGYHFGNSPESGKSIYEDLMARERVATQVVGEYGFVLLHTRTRCVTVPVFSLFRPEQSPFSDPYLQGAHTAVVMLAPMEEPECGTLMGSISSALVEDNDFLQAVRDGDGHKVRIGLEAILQRFLEQTVKQIFPNL